MRAAAHLLTAVLLFGFTAPLSGCGDDEEASASTRGARGGRSAKPPKKAKKASGPQGDSSLVPKKLQNVDWTVQPRAEARRESRDPFVPYVEDLVIATPDTNTPGTKLEGRIRPIDLYDVDELTLMAIVTGTALHKAMVKDPSGLGHVVREGDVVGRTTPMRVQRITRNEVLFKPLRAPTDQENQPKEVRKVLLTQEELEELLP